MTQKIYLIKQLKTFLSENNKFELVIYNSSLIEFNSNEFQKLITEFNQKELIKNDLIKSIGNKYLKDEFEKLLNINISKEDATKFATILSQIYTEVKSPEIVSEISFNKLMYVFTNKMILSFISKYYLENLKEDFLLTNSVSKRELQEFENMNNYRYLTEFTKFFSPLSSYLLELELNVYLNEIETNNTKISFLNKTREFYNVLIRFISNNNLDFKAFRLSLINERFYIKRNEIVKYDFFESLDQLKKTLDNEIVKYDNLLNQIREHKREIETLIKEKKTNNQEVITKIIFFIETIKDLFLK